MTQGGKKMEEIRKTSCIKRVISMLLAVLMILVSVPISSLTASAWGGPGFGGFGGWGRPGWGQTPDVMTNVRAEFNCICKYSQDTGIYRYFLSWNIGTGIR